MLIGNLVYDIRNDIFHFDYLIATVTSLLWVRCIILLRLTESFGPQLTMIYTMLIIILKFMFIFLLGLIAFSCIATLTLNNLEEF